MPIEALLFASAFTVAVGYPYWKLTKPTPEEASLTTREQNELIRKSPEYREWRIAVLKRDGFKCQWCDETHNLEVDHIYPFAFFPELRFDVRNGRTLCQRHHKETITYGSGSKIFFERIINSLRA
jgi:hypothetical protein